jgi:hypothetical protein
MRVRRFALAMSASLARGSGHHDDLAVPYSALRHDMLGEMLNLVGSTAQHVHLHAAVMVEVHVQRRERQRVMVVEGARQPLRELPCGMVVDVDERRHAILRITPASAACCRPARVRSRMASERFW